MLKLQLILLPILFLSTDLIEAACNYGTVADNNGRCQICSNFDNPNNVAKIVGGIEASPGSWPAQVYIYATFKGSFISRGKIYTVYYNSSCGGTLIDEFTVLTAAHCAVSSFEYNLNGVEVIATVNPLDEDQYAVFAGVHDKSSIDQSNGESVEPPGVKIEVKTVIIHPLYNPSNIFNDIAILQLKQPISFEDNIKLACLPNKAYGLIYPSTAKSNVTAFILGWGTTSENGEDSDLMLNAKIKIFPDSYCQNRNFNELALIDGKYQLCAGSMDGSIDTCQGDSGGGLYIFDDKLGKYVIGGIVSYGIGCGNPNLPGVYTRVSGYYDWIQSYMGKNNPLSSTRVPLKTTNPILIPVLSGAVQIQPMILLSMLALISKLFQ